MKKETKEFRELSEEELKVRLNELKEELFNLRMEKALGKISQPHRFRHIKRNIARVLTILNEKKNKG